MENFRQIEDVRGDHARSTSVNAMFNGYPDTLAKRWKHFVEYYLLIEVWCVSLPLLPRRLLEISSNIIEDKFIYEERIKIQLSINITINLHPGERYLHKRVDILVITFHTETAHVWQTVGPINRKNVESSLPVGYKFATDRQQEVPVIIFDFH